MNNHSKSKKFINHTSYPGGIKALNTFIDAHLQYPEDAVFHGIGGKVTINFDVDYKGNVSNVNIKHGIGHGCDEEAIRLVKMLKYAGTKNPGLFVVFHETLNINFNLQEYLKKKNQEELQKKNQLQLQITYTSTPKATATPSQPKPVTYNYTIKNK